MKSLSENTGRHLLKIWALADLHLPFGSPGKNMTAFGLSWKNYTTRIKESWKKHVGSDDLMLIAGDISWAMKLEDAMNDLEWIDALPGRKVILKGNHDYWWPSNKKLTEVLPSSIQFINKTAVTIGDVTIGGARLWDSSEYTFKDHINFVENPLARERPLNQEKSKRIFERDLQRLKISLAQMDPKASYRIAMTHYPPVSADLRDSQTSKILEEFSIDVCVFGHLHNVKKERSLFGKKNQVLYVFTAADYLKFDPVLVRD